MYTAFDSRDQKEQKCTIPDVRQTTLSACARSATRSASAARSRCGAGWRCVTRAMSATISSIAAFGTFRKRHSARICLHTFFIWRSTHVHCGSPSAPRKHTVYHDPATRNDHSTVGSAPASSKPLETSTGRGLRLDSRGMSLAIDRRLRHVRKDVVFGVFQSTAQRRHHLHSPNRRRCSAQPKAIGSNDRPRSTFRFA
jgi:hypothetical protein